MRDKNNNKFEFGDIVRFEGDVYKTYKALNVPDQEPINALLIKVFKNSSVNYNTRVQDIKDLEVVDKNEYPEYYL
jgi:uncharacterized ubiquitin-like protein YukD